MCNKSQSKIIVDLRRKAEMLLKDKIDEKHAFTLEEFNRLLYELEVNQVELDMQNKEVLRSKDEIEKAHNKYLDLYDFSPIGYFVCDINMVQIREVNIECATLLETERAKLKGKKFTSFIAPKSQDAFYFHRQKVLKARKKQVCVLELVKPNGSTFFVLLESKKIDVAPGVIAGVRTALIDITSQKRAEEDLRASQQKFQSMVDNIGIGVALISPKMEIIELNQKMREWFPGVDSGMHPICYMAFNDPPRDKACDYCPTVKTLLDGNVHESISATPSASGERNFRIISSPILNAQGEVTAAIEMVEDITERKKSNEKLKKVVLELETEKKLLLNKHIAFQEALKEIDIEKNFLKDGIMANVNEIILPIIRRFSLKGDTQLKQMKLLENSIEALISSFGRSLVDNNLKLTSKEIEICNMVKTGLTTKEISGILNVSSLTTDKHRRNIRKKLGLSNKNINLTSFLKSL